MCRHTIQDQLEINHEHAQLNHILQHLRHYYSDIKTKRQLNLDLPAGFRQDSTAQRNFKEFLPPAKSSPATNLSDQFHRLSTLSELSDDSPSPVDTLVSNPASVTNESNIVHVPIL
jgi:hypothetical protein